ncbi:hypothetical protein OIU77_030307 [Salix suchowensis]|uniref:Uncharacterized protein n=1 Tax=Salix suchowensis TaxID=1278906 RepID=A0ABQ9BF36_9ROSI|nr:hypothetical protein OIU77_030307 [Salix suchowensis]
MRILLNPKRACFTGVLFAQAQPSVFQPIMASGSSFQKTSFCEVFSELITSHIVLKVNSYVHSSN